MAIVLDKEIERAVEERLAPARRTPAAPSRGTASPVVRFSPLFADPPPASRRLRRILLWLSVAVHVVLVAIVTLMPRRAQTLVDPSLPIEIVFTAPMPSVPEAMRTPALPRPLPKPIPKPKPPPPIVEAPKPLPKPVAPESETAPVAKVEPPRKQPAVRTGLLDEAPAGPAIVASRTSRSAIVASGFDSSASDASSPARQGRVMEAAFDTQSARARSSRTSDGVVRDSGFGEEVAAAPRKRERERPASAGDSEVEILSKPKPVYTEEARGLRLEGDVVLDVTFEAGGVLRILDVAQGLGHGLDEAAIDAARKIRFNPARRDGAPVDHTAKLRVVFRLA